MTPGETSGEQQRKRVLIVDDDRDIRETLGEALESFGYTVVSAENGADALVRLRDDCRPCVILLDLMMPVMDGFQFMAARKLDPEIARIPVVVISAGGRINPNDVDADDYVQKPMKMPKLLSAIERHC